MVVGMITRWGIREQLEALHGWRLWAVRAAGSASGLMCDGRVPGHLSGALRAGARQVASLKTQWLRARLADPDGR
jgi:hypothetical protein